MKQIQLEQIAYAQGFAEFNLKQAIEHISGLPYVAEQTADLQAISAELQKAWSALGILSKGYDAVRKENADFERRMMLVRGALNS